MIVGCDRTFGDGEPLAWSFVDSESWSLPGRGRLLPLCRRLWVCFSRRAVRRVVQCSDGDDETSHCHEKCSSDCSSYCQRTPLGPLCRPCNIGQRLDPRDNRTCIGRFGAQNHTASCLLRNYTVMLQEQYASQCMFMRYREE